MSSTVAILLAIALLAGNAFFVGAEFAVISARRSVIEPMAEQGSGSARRTLGAMENVSMMLACAQLGITVCSLGLGALGEPAVAHLIEPLVAKVGLSEGWVTPLSFAIALAIVVYLHVVLGEMVPKNIALAGPERSALVLAPALAAVVLVLKPAIWFLNALANGTLRLLRIEPKDEVNSSFTADEVAVLIAESRREGLLEEAEHHLLQSAINLTDKVAGDLVLPLTDLVTVPMDATPREVQDLTGRTGYSRFPIAAADGDLTGYLHVKDTLLPADSLALDEPLATRLQRPLTVVSGDSPVSDVVMQLQSTGSHLGRVVDAEERTVGVVALEDLLEELIGEVRDSAHE